MKKNILVVDDSALMRRIICDIINSDEAFQVADTCRDGLEAYEKLKTTTYDGVVLDIRMPRMDGLELLKLLRKENIKTTVIMVSTLTVQDADITLTALELGAEDFVPKPSNAIEAKGIGFRDNLLGVLSGVLKKETNVPIAAMSKRVRPSAPVTNIRSGGRNGNKIVAIACSTGGPKALQSVIPFLPKDLNAPVVLVQHMPVGFTKSMAERLDVISPIQVKEAEDGEVLKKGIVYIAPGGKHMEVQRNGATHRISLNEMPPISGLRPCANIMYDSLRGCGYDQVVCVVLTGMGADGTKGILSLAKDKSVYVISEDAATCVVYGMPKAIAETGIVDEVVPLPDVAQSITKNVGVQ